MNPKVWLTVFGVIAALAIGGAGFYAFSNYRSYSDALYSWDEKVRTIENLERRVPFPNKDNSEALAAKRDEYQGAVQELFENLQSFQPELNTQLSGTEFQRRVSERVQAFRSFAREGGLAIEEPESFQMGFDIYSNQIPAPELVPVLDYELEAIERLLRELVEVSADELALFERDPIPGEPGGAQSQDSGVVHKYPIRMRFRADYAGFQRFINSLANDKTFFYIVRVLKVRNDQKEGPIKLGAQEGSDSDIPMLIHSETQQLASYEQLAEWGWDVDPREEVLERAREEGFLESKTDARVLMGQEKLNVFMVVDIVRFLSPEEVEAAKQAEAEKSSSRSRR